ncbi:long-chain-fatty-acid--CoA ligase [Vineibacter terrae]|uniref:long-chain-fatty-acid--CoA ligase n=1 Tax=Vineibacter terrae TaxID=2586908 RepID=UPI002E372E45|nr:long-chain-fatty-acid--CoA ligase [Vineibacter terrae]HEX2885302.1 long-chain-fatty-acid--CoA ligase [Vineibacter terrae]
MGLTRALHRAVQVNGNGAATIAGARVQSWHAFTDRVARLAGALRARGAGRGARVAMLARNSDRYLEYYYATFWAGGIAVPINTRWAVPEMVFALEDSGAEILVVDHHFKHLVPEIAQAAPRLRTIAFCGDGPGPAGALAWEEMAAHGDPIDDADGDWDEVAGIFYTGGTTGRSKGVMLSHGNLFTNSMAEAIWLNLRQRSSYLHAAPSFHLADAAAGFATTAVAGCHLFVDAFDPSAVLDVIRARGATHLLLVPTMIQMLLEHPAFVADDMRSVETIFYGGSPMSEALLARAIRAFPNAALVQAYGMTETTAIATVLEPGYHTLAGPLAGRLSSVGRAASHVEVKVVDGRGAEHPPGGVGEIVVRGPNVMKGYWNLPDLTAATVRNGWMHTGDAGYMDADGFLHVVDRLKDMIISGGENVYSAEVENAIAQHPGVRLCAVIGIPDARWGEAVHAVVWPTEPAAVRGEEIIAHCRKLIAGYKCPRSVDVTDRPVPLSAAGKILKNVLREPYWDSQGKQVH